MLNWVEGHRGQRSNFCISIVLHPILLNLGQFMKFDKRIKNTDSTHSKLTVIGVKVHISVSSSCLGILMKFDQFMKVKKLVGNTGGTGKNVKVIGFFFQWRHISRMSEQLQFFVKKSNIAFNDGEVYHWSIQRWGRIQTTIHSCKSTRRRRVKFASIWNMTTHYMS